jgi:hypothetical protein
MGLSISADSPQIGAYIEAKIKEDVWQGKPSYWIQNWRMGDQTHAPTPAQPQTFQKANGTLPPRPEKDTLPSVDEQFIKEWIGRAIGAGLIHEPSMIEAWLTEIRRVLGQPRNTAPKPMDPPLTAASSTVLAADMLNDEIPDWKTTPEEPF